MGKLLLLGYFGAGNLGDDGFVVDFLKRWSPQLRAHGQTCDYTAAGPRDPLEGFVEADEVRDLLGTAVSRKALLTLRPGQYDALVAPGGSLLQNATSMRSLLFYLHVIGRFTSAGVPVYMLGQGLGPFKGKLAGGLVAKTLKHVTLLTLRDKESCEWATTTTANRSISISCDSLLAGRLKITAEFQVEYPYVLIIPKLATRALEQDKQVNAITELNRTVSDLGLGLQLLSLHPSDRGLVNAIGLAIQEDDKRLRGDSEMSRSKLHRYYASERVSHIEAASMVVSYRLHGLILAAAYGVPGLGVAYDPKVSAFCDEMGLPYCTPQDVLDGKAVGLVRELWHNREQVKTTMLERRAVALQRLEAAEARFAQLLWGGA